MEKRIFKTRFKKNHPLSDNYYVKDRVMRVSIALVGKATAVDINNFTLLNEGTAEDYEKFKAFMERRYRGLCEFDI